MAALSHPNRRRVKPTRGGGVYFAAVMLYSFNRVYRSRRNLPVARQVARYAWQVTISPALKNPPVGVASPSGGCCIQCCYYIHLFLLPNGYYSIRVILFQYSRLNAFLTHGEASGRTKKKKTYFSTSNCKKSNTRRIWMRKKESEEMRCIFRGL